MRAEGAGCPTVGGTGRRPLPYRLDEITSPGERIGRRTVKTVSAKEGT
jgi:hypothetical protein